MDLLIPPSSVDDYLVYHSNKESNLSETRSAFNDSSNAEHELTKRLLALPISDESFNHYRCKGEIMVQYMFKTRQELLRDLGPWAESRFQQGDMYFYNNGWDRIEFEEPLQEDFMDSSILSLAGMKGVEGYGTYEPVEFADSEEPWIMHRSEQSTPYSRDDRGETALRLATGAIFETLINLKHEVVNMAAAWSPAYASKASSGNGQPLPAQQLPKVQKLSDGKLVEPPKWFLIQKTAGPPETLSVITSCLRRYGWGLNDLPEWANRVTFPIGTDCYNAILGTPNSVAAAMFLITHRNRLLPRVLASVTVYGSGMHNPNGFEYPNLLWFAGHLDRCVLEPKSDNERWQRNNPGDNDVTKFPHRLRPLPLNPGGDFCWSLGDCG